jgi:hypothetical protein
MTQLTFSIPIIETGLNNIQNAAFEPIQVQQQAVHRYHEIVEERTRRRRPTAWWIMMSANSSATGGTKDNPRVTDLKKGGVMASVDDTPVQAPQHSSRPSPMMSENSGATTSSPNSNTTPPTKDPQSNVVTPTKRPRPPPPFLKRCKRWRQIIEQGGQQAATSTVTGTDSRTDSSPTVPSKGNVVTPTKIHSGATTSSPNSHSTLPTKDQQSKRPTKQP